MDLLYPLARPEQNRAGSRERRSMVRGRLLDIRGSGNDVNFKIQAYTCTEGVNFTSSLVNAGSSDGFADVAFTVDGVSAWSNSYFVPKGGTLPINGHIVLDDCGAHAFDIVVQNQYKP